MDMEMKTIPVTQKSDDKIHARPSKPISYKNIILGGYTHFDDYSRNFIQISHFLN